MATLRVNVAFISLFFFLDLTFLFLGISTYYQPFDLSCIASDPHDYRRVHGKRLPRQGRRIHRHHYSLHWPLHRCCLGDHKRKLLLHLASRSNPSSVGLIFVWDLAGSCTLASLLLAPLIHINHDNLRITPSLTALFHSLFLSFTTFCPSLLTERVDVCPSWVA